MEQVLLPFQPKSGGGDRILVQGISYWSVANKSAPRGRRIHNFIELWYLVGSRGVDFCVSSTSFQKSNIGWPEPTRHHNSIKLWILLPLRADLLVTLQYEIPCMYQQDSNLYLYLMEKNSAFMPVLNSWWCPQNLENLISYQTSTKIIIKTTEGLRLLVAQ